MCRNERTFLNGVQNFYVNGPNKDSHPYFLVRICFSVEDRRSIDGGCFWKENIRRGHSFEAVNLFKQELSIDATC
jgi:hypothetical protein